MFGLARYQDVSNRLCSTLSKIYDICMIESKQVSERVIARYTHGMFGNLKREGHLSERLFSNLCQTYQDRTSEICHWQECIVVPIFVCLPLICHCYKLLHILLISLNNNHRSLWNCTAYRWSNILTWITNYWVVHVWFQYIFKAEVTSYLYYRPCNFKT